MGDCDLRPVPGGWLVYDRLNGRIHLCTDRDAAEALARMISRPIGIPGR